MFPDRLLFELSCKNTHTHIHTQHTHTASEEYSIVATILSLQSSGISCHGHEGVKSVAIVSAGSRGLRHREQPVEAVPKVNFYLNISNKFC